MLNCMRCVGLLMLMLLQTACLNVATTGAQAVYNHRSLQNTVSDQYITMQAYQNMNVKSHDFKNTNVTVSTYNAEVLLAGQVPTIWQREKAEQIVKEIPGVVRVYNQIEVSSPSSTLTRISDAWITTKVKSKLIASNDLDASQIKVVTENGMVYLMGILKPEEAQAAVDITRETAGVQGVVKIFSYMHITKKLA